MEFLPRNLAMGLLFIFFVQGVVLIQSTSPTADEVSFNVVNGYTYLKTRDYRMSPANPALLREWMTWPWLWLNPRLDLNKASWKEADSVSFAKEFFYRDNGSKAETLLFISRFMILLLGLGIGGIIYFWAKQLYGEWGAVLGLCFYAFCPNLLAHSALATTDIGVTFFCTMAAFFLWRRLEYSKPMDQWGFFLAFAFACAAKFNALLLGPAFLLVLWIKKGFWEFLKSSCYLLVSSFFVVWASYGFEWKPVLGGGVPRISEKLGYLSAISDFLFPHQESVRNALEKFALQTSIPMPSYLLGLAGILRSHRTPYLHYAFGHWTMETQWYYYLFCFAVKVTLPFLILLILRAVYFKKSRVSSGHENLVILLPAAAVFLATWGDSTAVGMRYLLPILPMLFVWVSGAAQWAANSRPWRRLLFFLVAANILTTLPAFPHYISYFNPLAQTIGGGYRYVRGSDVDWGQGLKSLKQYMTRHGIEKISLEYFGPTDPSFYGIDSEPFSEEEKASPQKKVYAVSVFYLEHVRWADRIKPTATAAGSIRIYDLR